MFFNTPSSKLGLKWLERYCGMNIQGGHLTCFRRVKGNESVDESLSYFRVCRSCMAHNQSHRQIIALVQVTKSYRTVSH